MLVPLSWLAEYVDIPEGTTPEEVHAALVRVGFEEESIRRFDVTGPVVVGQVVSREPEEHSNGKTINWCQVRVAPEGERAADGGDDVRGVVCGAHNFEAGDKVVVTLPGAVLPGDFVISARKTYGHVSDGMIASQRELGLGDDHEGIIVLSRLGLDPDIGSNALDVLGMNDAAIEINVTPDRGYAFSIRGVARELSHATGWAFKDPAFQVTPSSASGFPVTLQDDQPIRGVEGCTGFVTRLVTGINATAPTPAWMVTRLQLAGIRSLGLAVDISNYVMLELGNPLHAYDYSKLSGGITVRRAVAGEELRTLDGQDRSLHPEDLVIADDSGPIGLAGVMGGESTKTDDSTADVLIEAALFDPVSIARTVRRHKLPSEASRRFERSVDPLVGRAAAQRMVDLLVQLAGGTATDVGTDLTAPNENEPVRLAYERAAQIVGAEYSNDEVRGSLELIGCEVTEVDGELEVLPPSWRSDLTRAEDLVEEIARIVGYDRIPSKLPVAPPGRGLTREQKLRRRSANSMVAAGFHEVQNYPFVSAAQNKRFGAADERAGVAGVKLANPLDGEVPFLRRSLLPGLIQAAQRNLSRGTTDLALVEFGCVFEELREVPLHDIPSLGVKPSEDVLDEINASIPEQPLHAAAILIGDAVAKQPGQEAVPFDWADAIDAARLFADSVDASLVVRQGEHQAFHPGRTAELFIESAGELVSVGFAGELLPELVQDLHLPGRVGAVEVNLETMIALAPTAPRVEGVSTYPAATQDLTLLVPVEVTAHDVLVAVSEGAGPLLDEITLVDDYRGTSAGEGTKALTFALKFRAPDRTLKAEEATEAKLSGVALAQERYGAALQGA